ncbi:hypothetical protein EVAR_62860_1 [Eumeta japonica]|uniref:Uncharacterized protein n=1 Tax=Eumeta variegata TaxID=151549 RepID=A0A4C2A3Q1_EUMVA|nr:hypothetical protein EVAR_62860_1 [Eumeta japonica]
MRSTIKERAWSLEECQKWRREALNGFVAYTIEARSLPGFEILTSPLTSSNVTGPDRLSDRGRLSDELPPQSEMCKGSWGGVSIAFNAVGETLSFFPIFKRESVVGVLKGGYGLVAVRFKSFGHLPISSVGRGNSSIRALQLLLRTSLTRSLTLRWRALAWTY